MAFDYKQRECETCGGKLVYIAADKEYECTYCGNRYERTESYDGQFSVRYAAQQALSALASDNMDVAEDNLNECQKIDPSYPGTIVAQMAYMLAVAKEAQKADDRVKTKNAINQALGYRQKLPSFSPESCDVEADFYESIESADIRSLLQGVFRLFKDSARYSFVKEGFNPEDLHSEKTANDLVNCSFSEGNYKQIDAVLKSTAKLDTSQLLQLLLEKYPSGEQKVANIRSVVLRGVDGKDARRAASDYLVSSEDDENTKGQVVDVLAGSGIFVTGESVSRYFSQGASPETVSAMVGAICRHPQSDEDVEHIIGALFSHSTVEQAEKDVAILKEGGSFISFSQECMMGMLLREDLTVGEKKAFNKLAIAYGMTEKRRQGVFSALLTGSYPSEEKAELLEALAEDIASVNPKTAESYLVSCAQDGEKKPEIVKVLLGCVKARESLSYAAKQYASSSVDSLAVHNGVIDILAREGLVDSVSKLNEVVGSAGTDYALDSAREIKQAGVKLGPTVLADYLRSSLGTPSYSSAMFMELYSPESQMPLDLFLLFLLKAPDEEGKSAKAKLLHDCLLGSLDGCRCGAQIGSDVFEGSIWHVYLAGSIDGQRSTGLIADLLKPYCGKLNGEVSYSGKHMKFKKFLKAYRDKIPGSSVAYCESLRLM